jgi:hypothetical protein
MVYAFTKLTLLVYPEELTGISLGCRLSPGGGREMKKVVAIVVIGFVLFLGLSSNVFCAQGGGSHSGGSHGGSYHGGSYRGGYSHGGSQHYGGSRFYIGGYFGFPYYYPYGYPYYYPYGYPYSYYPYTDPQPPVYSEPEDFYWYYCQAPEGYYPYVESCPGGWTKVIPAPPESGKEGTAK